MTCCKRFYHYSEHAEDCPVVIKAKMARDVIARDLRETMKLLVKPFHVETASDEALDRVARSLGVERAEGKGYEAPITGVAAALEERKRKHEVSSFGFESDGNGHVEIIDDPPQPEHGPKGFHALIQPPERVCWARRYDENDKTKIQTACGRLVDEASMELTCADFEITCDECKAQLGQIRNPPTDGE